MNYKKNKKCRKTINKKYRRLGDIWGRLALKRRDNFITNLIYEYSNQSLYRKLKIQPKKLQRKLYEGFKPKFKERKFFFFQINTTKKRRRRKNLSGRGNLLRLRRQLSLFYGGGRIRQKTFRRYGKITTERKNTYTKNTHQLTYYDTFANMIESRLDILLLRCNFVDSIYKARFYVSNNKTWVQNKGNKINYPGYFIELFQTFGLMGNFTKKLKKILKKRLRMHTILGIPTYLYINFPLLLAFKMENPSTAIISYPFSENKGSIGVFRKSFQLL